MEDDFETVFSDYVESEDTYSFKGHMKSNGYDGDSSEAFDYFSVSTEDFEGFEDL